MIGTLFFAFVETWLVTFVETWFVTFVETWFVTLSEVAKVLFLCFDEAPFFPFHKFLLCRGVLAGGLITSFEPLFSTFNEALGCGPGQQFFLGRFWLVWFL